VHSADYVFFQSQFCRAAADRFLGPRQGRWEVLYNAVDTQAFSPAPSDPEPGALVVLLAGTHKHAYRVMSALEAVAQLVADWPNIRLVIAGSLAWSDDTLQIIGDVLERASRLGVRDRIRLVGRYAQAAAPELFRSCHVLLHTQYNDACPTVVLEAMASGLPVVYSRSGGTPELVGDTAGIGIPVVEDWEREIAPDPLELAEALDQVARKRAAYSSAARQRAVEHFDVRPWLERHAAVFQSLLK
jgi:glycosyltransferase involved in cell wall biosynthesis